MALVAIKENTRLKLELLVGMDGDKAIIKSKTYSRVKPSTLDEDLYEVGQSIGSLQILPIYKVKRLEEIELVDEEE